MELSEIKPAVRGQVWDTNDESKVVPTIQSYSSDELIKTDKQDLKLYTAEQMQQFKNDAIKDIFGKYNIFDVEDRRMQLGDLLGGQ